jgi:hypothetical protein
MKDLGLTGTQFGLATTLFYLAYIACGVPSNLILARIGARRWIGTIMIAWSLASTATLFATSPESLYVLRILVGITEAGFLPGMLLYLTYWFPAAYRARANALFMIAMPVTAAVGSAISGVILGMDGLYGLKGWQWLFLLEGLRLRCSVWSCTTTSPTRRGRPGGSRRMRRPHWTAPDLGVIGSNGLANPRDFRTPVAAYEDREGEFELLARFWGQLWRAAMGRSPLDVVAWHGNYAPYKYDLRRFNTIGSISYDHPDPSIFPVLQSASDTPGVDTIDFVIFPPRRLSMENTFRPPWFHRNFASEFIGLIHGAYDAKAEGFMPGGASLHNCMAAHGPDADTFAKASAADATRPDHITDTMAFMFETPAVIQPTRFALGTAQLQPEYFRCWQGLKKQFDPTRR